MPINLRSEKSCPSNTQPSQLPNIYNILGILGITALVQPIPIPPQIAQLDVWVMSTATIALIVAVVAWRRIGRWTGLVFLGAYAAYNGWLVSGV